MRIQLITFPECPNASAARAALERALASAGVTDGIEEVNRSDPDTPGPLRGWGSPTVLLDGEDAGGEAEPTGFGCRLYRGDDGRVQGTPPESLLSAALQRISNARSAPPRGVDLLHPREESEP